MSLPAAIFVSPFRATPAKLNCTCPEAARAVADAWEAIKAAAEFHKALLWAEAANRPLAARYHRTKKKRIRKKYAKRILEWYRTEVAPC